MEHRKEHRWSEERREPFRTGQPLPLMLVSWEPRESERQKYQHLGPLEKGPGLGRGPAKGVSPCKSALNCKAGGWTRVPRQGGN